MAEGDLCALRGEVERLRAAAEQSEIDHAAEIDRLTADMQSALATRGVIGQAMGVLMATSGCSADEAFALLKRMSQDEQRKVHDIAEDVSARTRRDYAERPPPPEQ